MIYLDYHAAAPPDSRALDAMKQAEGAAWANPSSPHAAGQRAKALLENARGQVAAAVGASRAGVVFTSGGTEALNLALLGLPAKRIITLRCEHPAVLSAVERRASRGVPVLSLDVLDGRAPTTSELAEVVQPGDLVAIQWINHETGTIFPIAEYAEVVQRSGAGFVVDAAQALGRLPIGLRELPISALSIASHKCGGPAGAGALVIRRGEYTASLVSLLLGGEQERGRRAGSPDVVRMVGFGEACVHLAERRARERALGPLRNELEAACKTLGGVVNAPRGRTASTLNVSFPGWRAPVLVSALDLEGVCVSAGAACSSGTAGPSKVLSAMYPNEPERALCALRMTLGPETTEAEVAGTIQVLKRVIPRGTGS